MAICELKMAVCFPSPHFPLPEFSLEKVDPVERYNIETFSIIKNVWDLFC